LFILASNYRQFESRYFLIRLNLVTCKMQQVSRKENAQNLYLKKIPILKILNHVSKQSIIQSHWHFKLHLSFASLITCSTYLVLLLIKLRRRLKSASFQLKELIKTKNSACCWSFFIDYLELLSCWKDFISKIHN
jgi:sensor c-di-GMP phosphodiesterase-like protein